MITKMKEIARKVFDYPLHMLPGDSIKLTYERTVIEGGILLPDHPLARREVLLSAPVTTARTVTEGVIFEGEYEGRGALGALFLEAR